MEPPDQAGGDRFGEPQSARSVAELQWSRLTRQAETAWSGGNSMRVSACFNGAA